MSSCAANNEQNDLGTIEDTKFERLIDQVLQVKQSNPTWTETEISNFIDSQIKVPSNERYVIYDTWNTHTDSEKKLVIWYPFDPLKVNKAKIIATQQTTIKFGYNGLGHRSDAFRHGIWNTEMTIMIGVSRTELFATAYENEDTTGVEVDGYLKTEHKNMDLHNNTVGRKNGSVSSSLGADEISTIIYNKIFQANTEFIWLHE